MVLERLVPRWLFTRLSTGARLQATSAARTGEWFEYAFTNQPHGVGNLGRWLDRQLLSTPHWQALRAIATEATSFLQRFVSHRRQFRIPTRILDLSPGTAPYLRDLLHRIGGDDLEAICLRRELPLLDYARQLVEQAQIPRLIFLAGDALDAPSYLGHEADVMLCLDATAVCPSRAKAARLLALIHSHLHPMGACVIGLPPPSGPQQRDHRNPLDAKQWLLLMEEQGFADLIATAVPPAGSVLRGWKRLTEQDGAEPHPARQRPARTG